MTRGSQESVIIQLVFNLIFKFDRKISADTFFLPTNSNSSHLAWRMEGGGVTHIFESRST